MALRKQSFMRYVLILLNIHLLFFFQQESSIVADGFRISSSLLNQASLPSYRLFSTNAPNKVDKYLQSPAMLFPNALISTNVVTLSRFMIEATRSHPDHADLASLIESIQIACKSISNLLSRTGLIDIPTAAQAHRPAASSEASPTSSSSPSETPSRNEVIYQMAINILKSLLAFTGKLGVMTFEQEENPILFEESWNSPYIAVFDALDGVQNIDIGIATGTIFGIYKEKEECLLDYGESISKEGKQRLLKNLIPSESLVAAGYVLYSSTTVLVFTLGEGAHGFTLDPYLGEFVLTHPNIKIPTRGATYSFNEARAPWWPAGLRDYVEDIKQGKGETGKTYTSRYIGSLTADVHRTLMKGGIFGYPGDTKSAPKGKLRLIHEVSPMAMIIEQAGGKGSTGDSRILNTKPESLIENVSTFLGSKEDVEEVEKYLAKHKNT